MLGGMGYHYTRGNNIFDDAIDLLNPEFLVYAPKNGPRQNDVARTRLAAVEYFLPFSAKFPSPDQPGFTKAPSLHDFPSTSNLPDVSFTPTDRFAVGCSTSGLGNNPAGMFKKNFGGSVSALPASGAGVIGQCRLARFVLIDRMPTVKGRRFYLSTMLKAISETKATSSRGRWRCSFSRRSPSSR
jgi:hypothetical protein